MTTTPQAAATGQAHTSFFTTPCFTVLDDENFDTLTAANLQRLIDTFEREFFTACPRDFAKSVAGALAKKANADSESRLEVALRDYPKPVVQEIVVRFRQSASTPTVTTVCVHGNEIMFHADKTIERAKAMLALLETRART